MSARKVRTPVHEPLGDAMLVRVAAWFRALAEPSRLRLLELLCDGERNVNDLAQAAGLSHANASKHLSLLCAAGQVTRRKDGTAVLYALADDTVREMCDLVCRRMQRNAQQEAQTLVRRGFGT